MKICYFGIFDPNFSRSRVIMKGLQLNGVEVILVNDRTPSWRKYVELWKQHKKVRGTYDAMIVGFPGYFTIFFARMITSKPIIFDAYISYYDGLLDRRAYSKYHPKALFARLADRMAGPCSVAVLTINEAYKKFFVETIGIKASKMFVLRKGADTDLFKPVTNSINQSKVYSASNPFIVGWWGTFIPLHGLQCVVEAAEILKSQSDIRIELVGRGQLKDKIALDIKSRGLTNIATLPPVRYIELPRAVSNYDVVLGIFNNNPKAFRCITNKVFEALALGKAIITETSPANHEIFMSEEDVLMVPPGDARALADAILRLKHDPALLNKIAIGGKNLFEREFTMQMIGAVLVDIIKEAGA